MAPQTDYKDDEDIMRRIASGDQVAFSMLFDQESQSIFRLAYVHLRDSALAEDITQETFARLWRHAGKWKPEAKIRTWLLTVARNLCIDMIRKQKNDVRKNQDFALEKYKDNQTPHNDMFLDNINREEMKKTLEQAIFLLPERQREALSLVYYMGCTGAEAAQVMGLKLAALESLLARARRNLRERLSEQRNELMEGIHAQNG